MSIAAAHPALAIWGSIFIVACLTLYALLRLTDERGHHTQARQFEAELDAAWQKTPPAAALHHDWYAAPTITLAPALQDATPEGGPSAGARAPEPPATDVGTADTRDGDPVAVATQGDEDPRPGGPPEGDEPAARPPQGTTGPGDLSPLAKAKAAMDAVAGLGTDEYLGHLDDATGYGDDAPFINWLSQATLARGFPPIKDEVA